MSNRAKSRYTVWTSPKNQWTKVFEDISLDEKLQKKLGKTLEEYDEESEKERLDAFATPVHEGSLGKSVG